MAFPSSSERTDAIAPGVRVTSGTSNCPNSVRSRLDTRRPSRLGETTSSPRLERDLDGFAFAEVVDVRPKCRRLPFGVDGPAHLVIGGVAVVEDRFEKHEVESEPGLE